MSGPAHIEPGAARRRLNWKLISAVIVIAGVAGVIGANAHLVYVAFASQPECVPHFKTAESSQGEPVFTAAGSAC